MKISLTITATLLAISLAGCGGSESAKTTTTTSSTTTTTLPPRVEMAFKDYAPFNIVLNKDGINCGWTDGTKVTVRKADGTIVANEEFSNAVGMEGVDYNDAEVITARYCKGSLTFPVTEESDFYEFEVEAPKLNGDVEITSWIAEDGEYADI